MMPSIPQLLIVMVIVMLIFGAGKLPQIGDALGRSIKNFKKASDNDNELEVGDKKSLGTNSTVQGSNAQTTKTQPEDADVVHK